MQPRRFLTTKLVKEIKTDLGNGLTPRQVSEKYNFAVGTIQQIRCGRIWSEVEVENFKVWSRKAELANKLNADIVREIKTKLKDPDVRICQICREYGLSRTTVHKIKKGETWKDIEVD